jgi:hypothetical protein
MTKEIRNPKSETDAADAGLRASGFGILSAFGIRHLGFDHVG